MDKKQEKIESQKAFIEKQRQDLDNIKNIRGSVDQKVFTKMKVYAEMYLHKSIAHAVTQLKELEK